MWITAIAWFISANHNTYTMNITSILKQIQEKQTDLERRFEALEDWLGIHYTRERLQQFYGSFPAEYKYTKTQRFYNKKMRRNKQQWSKSTHNSKKG